MSSVVVNPNFLYCCSSAIRFRRTASSEQVSRQLGLWVRVNQHIHKMSVQTPHSLLRSEPCEWRNRWTMSFSSFGRFFSAACNWKSLQYASAQKRADTPFCIRAAPIKHQRLGFPPLRDALHIHLIRVSLNSREAEFRTVSEACFPRLFFHAVSVIIRRRCIFLLLHFLVFLTNHLRRR